MAVQGSVQMGKVIFQERQSGRKKTERECRKGKKVTGIERKKTKIERERTHKKGKEEVRKKEIDNDRVGEGKADRSHRSQNDLDS